MGARALLLGLDGATWTVIDAHAARLPNLSRLRRQGRWARLNSTTPPMTLPAWSSIITGCQPGKHGIYDFVRRVPGAYGLEFQSARDRRVPTIFRLLSDRGHRVASIAMPTTWPPESVDGVMVAGFDSPVATAIEAAHCQPRTLFEEIRGKFGGMAFADFQEGDTSAPGWHAHALRRLLREVARKEALCRWLLDREDWTLFSVVFGESDTVSHHFWAFADPASPRHLPGFADAILRVYERLDWAVGELAGRAETVCVCSDHGFGGAGDEVLYINRFLESRGWLRVRKKGGARADRLRKAAMRLPVERIVRRVPAGLLGRAESLSRYGDIDFGGTKAWSDEMNYAATIHLNLAGRDPQGQPVELDRLVDDLLGWTEDGRPVVAAVHRADELWGTDRAPGAPDLVLTLATVDGYSRTVLPSARVSAGTTWRRIAVDERAGGKGLGMNGSHRQHGVLIVAGRTVTSEDAGRELSAGVADVAPTLLALLGEEVPSHMDGRALLRGVSPGRASSSRETGLPRPTGEPPAASGGDPEILRRRLKALGYLD